MEQKVVKYPGQPPEGKVAQYLLTIPDTKWPTRADAIAAIQNNAAFLAIGTPSTAQAVAQVNALTRQMNRIITYLLVTQFVSYDEILGYLDATPSSVELVGALEATVA